MASLNLPQVLQALRAVLPDVPVALHEPEFGQGEKAYVQECLDTGWVSSVGRFVDRFEADLAAYTGARRAVAVVNGTAALHICLKLAGVEAGDEVLMPSLTFVATANAAHYCGAIPHFIDSEETTLGIDPAKLDAYLDEIAVMDGPDCRNRLTGRRLKAIVPVHIFGHPVDLEPLMAVAERWQLTVVEDAAESLGSRYHGVHTGRFGRLAALSFNGNKIITTGGGGAILTDDDALADRAKHITTTARLPHRWSFVHDEAGFNYRMPNLNAALGCAQLERLPAFLEDKRRLAHAYRHALAGVAGLRFVDEPSGCQSNYWLNAVLLDEDAAEQRDELLETTNAAGIMTRPAWALMHHLPMHAPCPRMPMETAEALERRLVNLPSSAKLGRAR